MEAVQLMKDYTTEGARGAIEFIWTPTLWNYEELIEHLWTSFKSGKTFSSLFRDFYSHFQCPQETEDQFADELQILGQQVISVRPSWKNEVNQVLKHSSPFDCAIHT